MAVSVSVVFMNAEKCIFGMPLLPHNHSMTEKFWASLILPRQSDSIEIDKFQIFPNWYIGKSSDKS